MKKLLLLLLSLSTIAAFGMQSPENSDTSSRSSSDDELEIVRLAEPLADIVTFYAAKQVSPRKQEALNKMLFDALCFDPRIELIRAALDAGADANAQSHQNAQKTALEMVRYSLLMPEALQENNKKIAQLLIQKGGSLEPLLSRSLNLYAPDIGKYIAFGGNINYALHRIDEEFEKNRLSDEEVWNRLYARNILLWASPLSKQILSKLGPIRTALTDKLEHHPKNNLEASGITKEFALIVKETRLQKDFALQVIKDRARFKVMESTYFRSFLKKWTPQGSYYTEFFKSGLPINLRDSQGRTGLWIAAELGHAHLVEFFLKQPGIDANPKNQHTGQTLLEVVANRPNGDWIKSMIEKHNAQAGAFAEQDPVITPVKKAALNAQLISAAKEGDIELVRTALAQGADADIRTKTRKTPLMIAAENGDKEIVKLLLMYGAHIDAQDNEQQTPFFYATVEGNVEIFKMLKSAGADIKKTYADLPLLAVAVDPDDGKQSIRDSRLAQPGREAIAKILIEDGADIHFKPSQSEYTLLHIALINGYCQTAKLLIEKDIDIHAKVTGDCDENALIFAAQGEHEDVARILAEKGADVDSLLDAALELKNPSLARTYIMLSKNKDEAIARGLNFVARELHTCPAHKTKQAATLNEMKDLFTRALPLKKQIILRHASAQQRGNKS